MQMVKGKTIEEEIYDQHLFSQMNIVNYALRRVNFSSPSVNALRKFNQSMESIYSFYHYFKFLIRYIWLKKVILEIIHFENNKGPGLSKHSFSTIGSYDAHGRHPVTVY